MSRRPRKPLQVVCNGMTIVIRGNAKLILDRSPFRAIYVGTQRGWMLDAHRLPDLCAYLDLCRVPYELDEAA